MKIPPFKNYTTGIDMEKIVIELEQILTRNKATRIIKDYDSGG